MRALLVLGAALEARVEWDGAIARLQGDQAARTVKGEAAPGNATADAAANANATRSAAGPGPAAGNATAEPNATAEAAAAAELARLAAPPTRQGASAGAPKRVQELGARRPQGLLAAWRGMAERLFQAEKRAAAAAPSQALPHDALIVAPHGHGPACTLAQPCPLHVALRVAAKHHRAPEVHFYPGQYALEEPIQLLDGAVLALLTGVCADGAAVPPTVDGTRATKPEAFCKDHKGAVAGPATLSCAARKLHADPWPAVRVAHGATARVFGLGIECGLGADVQGGGRLDLRDARIESEASGVVLGEKATLHADASVLSAARDGVSADKNPHATILLHGSAVRAAGNAVIAGGAQSRVELRESYLEAGFAGLALGPASLATASASTVHALGSGLELKQQARAALVGCVVEARVGFLTKADAALPTVTLSGSDVRTQGATLEGDFAFEVDGESLVKAGHLPPPAAPPAPPEPVPWVLAATPWALAIAAVGFLAHGAVCFLLGLPAWPRWSKRP